MVRGCSSAAVRRMPPAGRLLQRRAYCSVSGGELPTSNPTSLKLRRASTQRPTLNVQRSTSNVQRSTLNVQRPTSNAQRPSGTATDDGLRTTPSFDRAGNDYDPVIRPRHPVIRPRHSTWRTGQVRPRHTTWRAWRTTLDSMAGRAGNDYDRDTLSRYTSSHT